MKKIIILIGLAGCAFAQNVFPPASGAGGGATIPSITNIIKGNGSGNGADTKVAITSPATAATLIFPTDNASITLQGTDTYIGRSTVDTLSNKLFASPVTPVVVSSSSPNVIGSGATMTIAAPASIANGNCLVAAITFVGVSTETWGTVPSGWTQTGSNLASTASGKVLLAIFQKIASSESGSYTWIGNNSTSLGVGTIINMSGALCAASVSGTATANAANVTVSTISPTVANSLLLIIGGKVTSTTAVQAPGGTTLVRQNNGLIVSSYPLGYGPSPSFTLDSTNTANDFVETVLAFSPLATTPVPTMNQGDAGTLSSLYVSGGAQIDGQERVNSLIIPNNASTTTTSIFFETAAGIPAQMFALNSGNAFVIDPNHAVSSGFFFGGGIHGGAFVAGQSFYAVSWDDAQDVPLLRSTSTNDLHVGNNNISGGNEERDLYLDIQTGLAIHANINNSDYMAIDSTNGVSIADMSTLAAESLTNGALTSGTSWTFAGDFASSANTAVYTDSSHAGTITQASGTLAVAGIANSRYVLAYDVITPSGGVAPSGTMVCSITTGFANAAIPLNLTSAGAGLKVYFTSATSPGNFVISCTSAATNHVTLDNLSLKRSTAGSLNVTGSTRVVPVAVANLPATPIEGMRAAVTDSNAASCTAGVGATVVGGGSVHCPVYYNGTNWIIF